jgi:hypothetical protein
VPTIPIVDDENMVPPHSTIIALSYAAQLPLRSSDYIKLIMQEACVYMAQTDASCRTVRRKIRTYMGGAVYIGARYGVIRCWLWVLHVRIVLVRSKDLVGEKR